MGKQRTKRISEEIKKIVSQLIMFEIKDPRISKLTSVTHVDTTNDLSFTNIYISVYDPKADPVKTIAGLNSAKGFIRKEIGSALKLRVTPEPVFKLDQSIENGLYINDLLKKVGADDFSDSEVEDEDLDPIDDEEDFDIDDEEGRD